MALGPSRYASLCQFIFEHTKAQGAIVVVLNGLEGSGMAGAFAAPELAAELPKLLRYLANSMEAAGPTANFVVGIGGENGGSKHG